MIASGGYGVPTLFFGDHALFGPVLIDPPSGDAAVRLWNAVTAWLEFPALYELQKPKTKVDERRIVETFRPYVEARDWVSINRGMEVGFTDDGFVAVGRRADRATGRVMGADVVDTTRHTIVESASADPAGDA